MYSNFCYCLSFVIDFLCDGYFHIQVHVYIGTFCTRDPSGKTDDMETCLHCTTLQYLICIMNGIDDHVAYNLLQLQFM